jgi:citrate lyase beta subunit
MESRETSGSGAVSFRGMMVDYAMVAPAKAILREAARRGLI